MAKYTTGTVHAQLKQSKQIVSPSQTCIWITGIHLKDNFWLNDSIKTLYMLQEMCSLAS